MAKLSTPGQIAFFKTVLRTLPVEGEKLRISMTRNTAIQAGGDAKYTARISRLADQVVALLDALDAERLVNEQKAAVEAAEKAAADTTPTI